MLTVNRCRVVILLSLMLVAGTAIAGDPWVDYKGHEGPGKGKRIVLLSGDEEYRSEEGLPELGKILSQHHGFDCRVLFSIDPKTGIVNPNYRRNVAGMSAIKDADLIIVLLRWRDLPDDQLALVDEYLKAGKPVIGIRTATHAFKPEGDTKWPHYSDQYNGSEKEWEGGFGRLVLGEHWVSHHGSHKQESTRGMIAPGAADHPILRGIKDGDIWGSTDVYTVRLPLPGDSQPLVLGQVVARKGAYNESDKFYGMRPDDGPPVAGKKNDPMMPIAWAKTYQLPGGKPGRAVCSTIGASVDLTNDAVRRLLVNSVYWGLHMEDKIPEKGTNVAIVGAFNPTQYGFRPDDYWTKRHMTPDEHRMQDVSN